MPKTSINAVLPDANNVHWETILSSRVATNRKQPPTLHPQPHPTPNLLNHFAQSTHPPDTHPISYSQSSFWSKSPNLRSPLYKDIPFELNIGFKMFCFF